MTGEERLVVGILLIGPSHSGHWENTRGEPGIKDILILGERDLCFWYTKLGNCILKGLSLVSSNNEVIRVVLVRMVDDTWDSHQVNRHAMTPPKLA